VKRHALAGLLAALCSTACIQLQWSRSSLHQPIDESRTARFEVGDSSMAEALDELGAPLYVWQLPRGHAALAWGWFKSRDLSVQVSVPTKSPADPSFQFTQIDNRLRGYVFVFDDADELVFVKRGYLAEIADELRQRSVCDVERAQEMLRDEAD
jgi:hypothetical protein